MDGSSTHTLVAQSGSRSSACTFWEHSLISAMVARMIFDGTGTYQSLTACRTKCTEGTETYWTSLLHVSHACAAAQRSYNLLTEACNAQVDAMQPLAKQGATSGNTLKHTMAMLHTRHCPEHLHAICTFADNVTGKPSENAYQHHTATPMHNKENLCNVTQ